MPRLRRPISDEYPPKPRMGDDVGVDTWQLRPSRYIANQAIQLRPSTEGEQPRHSMTMARMPARRSFLYRRIMQRHWQTGPANEPVGFGHPPVGNLPPNFRQRPPRRMTALIPSGVPNWTPSVYGPRGGNGG